MVHSRDPISFLYCTWRISGSISIVDFPSLPSKCSFSLLLEISRDRYPLFVLKQLTSKENVKPKVVVNILKYTVVVVGEIKY